MNLKDIMKEYFLSFSNKNKIAWCTSVGPAEILRAAGYEVFFPENHGAMLGASRLSMETMVSAHAFGYSPDVCSYLTSDIGSYLKKLSPLKKYYGMDEVPRPNILVYSTNQCVDVMHWFEFYAKEFNVPSFGVFCPRHLRKVEKNHIDCVVKEFRSLIKLIEELDGKKFDFEELKRVLSLSKKASELWRDVLNLGKKSPSPLTFFDSVIYMGPIVVLRGTEKAVDYYKSLYDELQNKKSSFEKLRLYWEGMPIWGRLRSLSELFRNYESNIVASTYCNSWIFDAFDEKNLLESMAEAYLSIFINRDESFKEEYLKTIVRDFKIDGIIFHNSKTCPNNSNSRYNMPNRLRNYGIQSIIIDGDLNDLRCFSDEASRTIIEAFLENLKNG